MKPMPEPGQLRVWGDGFSIDKTPFLMIARVDSYSGFPYHYRILWHDQLSEQPGHYVELLSELIDEAR